MPARDEQTHQAMADEASAADDKDGHFFLPGVVESKPSLDRPPLDLEHGI